MGAALDYFAISIPPERKSIGVGGKAIEIINNPFYNIVPEMTLMRVASDGWNLSSLIKTVQV